MCITSDIEIFKLRIRDSLVKNSPNMPKAPGREWKKSIRSDKKIYGDSKCTCKCCESILNC